jgi:drug/metabolite transporter (DMT)-like permease
MYILGLLSGGAAVLVSYLEPIAAVLVAVVAFAVVLTGVLLLERAPYEHQSQKPAAFS